MKLLGFVFGVIVVTICTKQVNSQLSPTAQCQNHGKLVCDCLCECPAGFCGLYCQDKVIYGCKEIRDSGRRNGVYNMTIGDRSVIACTKTPVLVYCDMCLTTGKAWTVIQRRINGQLSFYQQWSAYENGFGDPDAEFWIGNKHLASITQNGRWILRIEMTKTLGDNAWAEYNDFKIGYANTKYLLQSVGQYSGTAGDSMSCQVGSQFSTYDQDNDKWVGANCAQSSYCYGAWWYGQCSKSNLNGIYATPQAYSNMCGRGVNWETWGGYTITLKRVSMLIRPYDSNGVTSLAQQSVMVDLPKSEPKVESMAAIIEAEEPKAMQADNGGAEPDAANVAERAFNDQTAYDAAEAEFAEALRAQKRKFYDEFY